MNSKLQRIFKAKFIVYDIFIAIVNLLSCSTRTQVQQQLFSNRSKSISIHSARSKKLNQELNNA